MSEWELRGAEMRALIRDPGASRAEVYQAELAWAEAVLDSVVAFGGRLDRHLADARDGLATCEPALADAWREVIRTTEGWLADNARTVADFRRVRDELRRLTTSNGDSSTDGQS